MIVSPDKKYETAVGNEVKIYAIYEESRSGIVHGAFLEIDKWYSCTWDLASGKCVNISSGGRLDLVLKKKTVTLYGNIFLTKDSRTSELSGTIRNVSPFLFETVKAAIVASGFDTNVVQAKITFEVDE